MFAAGVGAYRFSDRISSRRLGYTGGVKAHCVLFPISPPSGEMDDLPWCDFPGYLAHIALVVGR